MPRGFYVSRALAARAIELMDARSGQSSGYRFHPSIRNPKLSRYEPDKERTIPWFLKCVGAWAKRDTDFFRPGFLPAGDDMVVVCDDLVVCYLALVHRRNFDAGISRHTYEVYDQVLWAEAHWHMWASVPSGAPQKVHDYTLKGVKHAGATIVSSATLEARIANGSDGSSSDTVVFAGLNPLFGHKG